MMRVEPLFWYEVCIGGWFDRVLYENARYAVGKNGYFVRRPQN